mmetsp:Transcript_5857/g.22198  ORF Transcript_5857/g.22198 Transcript_5857/m.22198 type:complete len:243 (+) Transcript_5857:1158-1886(+)
MIQLMNQTYGGAQLFHIAHQLATCSFALTIGEYHLSLLPSCLFFKFPLQSSLILLNPFLLTLLDLICQDSLLTFAFTLKSLFKGVEMLFVLFEKAFTLALFQILLLLQHESYLLFTLMNGLFDLELILLFLETFLEKSSLLLGLFASIFNFSLHFKSESGFLRFDTSSVLFLLLTDLCRELLEFLFQFASVISPLGKKIIVLSKFSCERFLLVQMFLFQLNTLLRLLQLEGNLLGLIGDFAH